MKKIWGTGLISAKMKYLYAEFNKRVEAATRSYSATTNFLQYVYSVLLANKNRQKTQSKRLVHEYFS